MYNSISFYCFIAFLNCNLKNVFSEETIPVRPNFTGKYTSGISNYEVIIPQRVNEDGSLISHVVSHRHSKRSTKELEFIFYKIPIGGKDYLIELTPNRKLISPGAVIEIHKENVRRSANRKSLNGSLNNETIGEMFRNLDIRKLQNTDCYFSGTVKGENVSKAALSTCFGLAGFIQISKGFYTIEPVAEHDPLLEDAHPHILYKTDELDNSSVCHAMGELSASLVRKRRESSAGLSLPLYIETLIVMDKTLTSHHPESDCENYILTVFNMADNLFHDASLGLMMSLTLVRMIRMEVENDEMNLRVSRNAEKTLKYFQNWQYEMNPGDDSHPNHHDVAVLVTKVNICNSKSSCGLLGLTTIGKACDPKLSAALCEDNGLRLGHIMAHEIGHLLGADHDSDNSTSNGTDANGLKTVMHPDIPTTAHAWSSSSQAYFKAFLGSGLGNCLLDEPEEHHFNVLDLLPGVMYNADFQCKNLITDNARECDMGSNCESLNCFVPGYSCIITHTPPADGTFCGENMWCHDTKCLVVGERPGAIDGNWGEWSAWSDCSRTCGSGVASSERNCDKPQPSHGGKNCVGERKRYKICAAMKFWECLGNYSLRNLLRITTVPQNISDLIRFISEEVNVSFVGKPCETGRPSFRDIQCGEFNDWIYPEDGKLHTWMAYFSHDDNPCILYCVNEEKQVAALKPRVVDGTMCFRGIRDICVGGICKSLPCDLHFESNAVEDACGICHGDGTGCEFSEGTETLSKFTKGLTKLVNIPSGTRNIKVEELSPTLAKIIVKDKDTKEMYVRGTLGMFTVPGSQAWLGMIKKNQAALNIPGPVSKPLSIWIQRLDNVTVKWSMALPAEQQRKPEFTWDFLRWGPCSAKCGPGTQISKPSCMEGKAGLVEDSFCADLEMPPTKVRKCEVTRCETRWMVGDWRGCEKFNPEKHERKRIVYCIKPVGEGEGESQIVSDSQCPGPKPHEREPCDDQMKRKRNLYTNSNSPENDYPIVSEYGFHSKYEDYQRRFEVPQKYSKTIPPNQIFSRHFKHYLLENLPSGTRYEAQAQYDVSPVFYKTFSRRQVGVTHIQPGFLRNIRSLGKGSKKSLNWEYRQMHRKRSNYPLAERHSNWLMQLRHNRTASVTGIRDVENLLILNHRYKKSYNYKPPNLTINSNPNESDRPRFSDFLKNCRTNEMSSNEITKLKRLWNALNSKYSDREKRNMNHFFKTSECNEKLINTHDKEIDETIAKLYQKDKNRGNKIQESQLSNRGISKPKRASLIWKKPKSKDGNLKLPKEQTESEPKNYLNNLFRDNHPKQPPSNKPPEIQTTIEKPIIKEGFLVIDKDPPENQEMEILFDNEETEGKRRKFVKMPQKTRNERKITIKGQDVFNLFQEIQDRGDNRENSGFYRSDSGHTEKLDISIKVPEPTAKPETTESTTTTTKASTEANQTTKAPEKSSEETSADKQEKSKETKEDEESTRQEANKKIKTVLETLETSDSGTTESNSDNEGCDVDEEIIDESDTGKTQEEKKQEEKEEKEEKKKKKMEKKKEKKRKKEEKKKEKEEKKKEKEARKKEKEAKKKKKKKKEGLEDPDFDWVDLVWTGFPRNQEEKLTGDGCNIDDEVEKYFMCTEASKTEAHDPKEKEKEEKERRKEEKRKRKEEKKNEKWRKKQKNKKKKNKSMKTKVQKNKLGSRQLKLENHMRTGFSMNQEEKLIGDGYSADDETEKYFMCTEASKTNAHDPKEKEQEEKGRRKDEKMRRKEQKKIEKEEKRKHKLLEKKMKKKTQREELLHQALKFQDYMWTEFPDIKKEKMTDYFDSARKEIDDNQNMKLIPEKKVEKIASHPEPSKEAIIKYEQRKLFPEYRVETSPDYFDSGKEEIFKCDLKKLFPQNQGEMWPDFSDADKEEIFKFDQMKLFPEDQGEMLPDYFDSDKDEIFKFDQTQLFPENQGEMMPYIYEPPQMEIFKYDQTKLSPETQEEKQTDNSDTNKEEIQSYDQTKLFPEKQEEKQSDNSGTSTEETQQYDQRMEASETQAEKQSNNLDTNKQETDKYDQTKLFPETQEEKQSDNSDTNKEETQQYDQTIVPPETQGENQSDNSDTNKEETQQYDQTIVPPETQEEKQPNQLDSNKEEPQQYDQTIVPPETRGEKQSDNSDTNKEETQQYDQRMGASETQGEKQSNNLDTNKEEIQTYEQTKLSPETQEEKQSDNSDTSTEETQQYDQTIVTSKNLGEERTDHSDSSKEETDIYEQTKLFPENKEEMLPDHANSDEEEIQKYDQKKLFPESQEEKQSDNLDTNKEEIQKYGRTKLFPEKEGQILPDHSDPAKEDTFNYDQRKQFPENQGELSPDQSNAGKDDMLKYDQRKQFPENQGELSPDQSNTAKEDTFNYDQRKSFPENQGELSPDQSNTGKDDRLKYDQRKQFPENPGELLPDQSDDIFKYNQRKLFPDIQGGMLPDPSDPDKEDIFSPYQRKMLPDYPADMIPDYLDSMKDELDKYDQLKLFPENQEEPLPDYFDSGEEESEKFDPMNLYPESELKWPDNFDKIKEEIDKYAQMNLFPESQVEKLPDLGKEKIDKHNSKKFLPENEEDKWPDYFEKIKQEIDKYAHMKPFPESLPEKKPDHFDKAKDKLHLLDIKKLFGGNRGDKRPDHSDSSKDKFDEYENTKVFPGNEEANWHDHSNTGKEEIAQYEQVKLFPENLGELLPDYFDSGKEDMDKSNQRKLFPENQCETLPEYFDPGKKEIVQYEQMKLFPENQEETMTDYFDLDKGEVHKHDHRKLSPKNHAEKCHDHPNSGKKEIQKFDHSKLLEKEEKKVSDHIDSTKKEIDKYDQKNLHPENQREKPLDHLDSAEKKKHKCGQKKLSPENLEGKLAIQSSGNDEINNLRSSEDKWRKNRRKEEKIIEKERKHEQKIKINEERKRKKKIKTNIKDTRKPEVHKNAKLPKWKTEYLAKSDAKLLNLINKELPLNEKETLAERPDSGNEEKDNSDTQKPSTEQPDEVLGAGSSVDSKLSKRLRYIEKKRKKDMMKVEKQVQKQREEEERNKLEEGVKLKKLIIRRNKERKQRLLHKKFNPKKKDLPVEHSNPKWGELLRTAFPINQEVRLTDHFDADKEEAEEIGQRKLVSKNQKERLTMEDLKKGPEKPKSKDEIKKEKKANKKQAKKDKKAKEKEAEDEVKKQKKEGKKLEKVFKKKEKLAKKIQLRIIHRCGKGKHLTNFDPDLANVLRSGSLENQEENFVGLGCDFDNEITRHSKTTENTKNKKKEEENETNFGCDADEQIVQYLKFPEKSKLEKKKQHNLECNKNNETEKHLQYMKAKKETDIPSETDDKKSTYFQYTEKTKTEEKQHERKKREDEKSKKKLEKEEEKEQKRK